MSTAALPHITLNSRQKLDTGMSVVVVLILLYSLFSYNPFLSLYAWLVLLANFFMLWKPGMPPILFWILTFQWLQASTRILQANFVGLPLNDFAASPYGEASVYLALTVILVLGFAFRLVLNQTPYYLEHFKQMLQRVSIERTFICFLAFLVILPALNQFRRGGVAQIIYAAQSFDWAVYCLLIFASLQQKRGYLFVLIAFSIKFLLGFSGYFSGFKEPLIITAIALGTFRHRLSFGRMIWLFPMAIGVFTLFVIWTGVKKDYRKYLNSGTESQVIRVSRTEALDYLSNAFVTFDFRLFGETANTALERLQYTQMTQFCMEYIPAIENHSNGKVWRDAVSHVFMPRILFPNKPVLDDSEIARRYTGRPWRGRDQGSSISIGYVAESYVDFGVIGMFVPIFLLGLFVGWIHRLFMGSSGPNLLLNAGAIIAILLQFQLLEKSTNKIIGGIIMSTLVYVFIVQRFIYPVVLRWLYNEEHESYPTH